ncbi:hypothetical protein COC52_29185 [Priestia megaterium]|jgi:hypothetical protein|uniref:hypothetical protein n=1 Tax=Priestia megaterium TaxID=1404 RepID=UPI000BFBB746|nr:hypothetical protein [Priestia megaterium]PGR17376.1 hypothetical protein COC52_29185 [Priestia megaterium]
MQNKEIYTQTELANKCNIPESTIRKRCSDFGEYFSPIRQNNNVFYSKYDYYKMVFIQGLRKTSPTLSKFDIAKKLEEFCEDLETLVLIDKIIKKNL